MILFSTKKYLQAVKNFLTSLDRFLTSNNAIYYPITFVFLSMEIIKFEQ
jgi:hypothetical protein